MNYPASYPRALAALAALILSAGSMSAETYTYDADTATANAQDGSGLGWNTSNTNWLLNGGGSDVLWPNLITDTAVFGAGGTIANAAAGTVTVGTVNVGLIQFNQTTTTGYTLTGGSITLGTGITTTSSVANTISAVITGTNGLALNGVASAGNGVTLSGANTYTGITTISTGGRFTSSNATALGANDGPGATVLGTNYTQVNAGTTLQVSTSTAEAFLINGTGSNSGGALRFGNGQTISSFVQLESSSLITGAFGTGTISGNLDLGTNTLSIGNGSNTISLTVSGQVTGTGGITVNTGTGNVNGITLTNLTNNYSGTTTVNTGTFTGTSIPSNGFLGLGGDTVLGTSTLVFGGGTVRSNNATARTIANTIGAIAANPVFGELATQTGALNFTYNTAPVSLGNAVRTFTTHVDTAFASGFSSSGSTGGILKQGAATLTISGPSTYSGVTTVNRGTLLINSTTGTGAVTVNNLVGAVVSGQAATGASGAFILTAVDNAAAGTLQLGQSINGTNIPSGTVISGIHIGASTATILLSKAISGGAVTAFTTTAFNSASTLGGIGTINGATTVNSGTFLAPGTGGTTTGVLSFGSTLSLAGTTTFDFNGATRGSGFDGINVTGALTNGGGLVLNFSTTLTGGTYDLFALGSQSGDFASVTLTGLGYGAGSLVNSSGTWTGNIGGSDFTYVQSTGDLTISSVPEPSTFAALAGIAVLGLATLRRRRNA